MAAITHAVEPLDGEAMEAQPPAPYKMVFGSNREKVEEQLGYLFMRGYTPLLMCPAAGDYPGALHVMVVHASVREGVI